MWAMITDFHARLPGEYILEERWNHVRAGPTGDTLNGLETNIVRSRPGNTREYVAKVEACTYAYNFG